MAQRMQTLHERVLITEGKIHTVAGILQAATSDASITKEDIRALDQEQEI